MSSSSFKGGEADDDEIPSETKPSEYDNPSSNDQNPHINPPTSPSQAAVNGVHHYQLKQVAVKDLQKHNQPPAPNVEKQEDKQSLFPNPAAAEPNRIYTAYPEGYQAQSDGPPPPQPHPPDDPHDQPESDESCCRNYCCCCCPKYCCCCCPKYCCIL